MRCVVGIIVILLLGMLLGCQQHDAMEEHAGTVVPVFREFKGQQAPFPDAQFLVIQRPDTWAALWSDRPAPEVDFTQSTVLGVTLGQQATAGYEVAITDVRATGQEIVAYVEPARPAAGDEVAQVLTYPYHFVVVPRLTQPVTFQVAGRATPPIALQEQYQGVQARSTNPQTAVIRDPAAWRDFWVNNISASTDAPSVDFTQYMAVAVLIGRQPTTGYSTRIVSVETAPMDQLAVQYRTTAPARGQQVVTQPTAPYAIALVRTSPAAVAFRQLPAVVVAAAPQP